MQQDGQGNTGKEREPVYEDDPDRGYNEAMQDPEKLEALMRAILERRDADLPDLIILSELPQVPEEALYEPIEQVVARTEGNIRNTRDVEIRKPGRTVIFKRPKSTRFARVILNDGREAMERYDPDRHGPWEDIPDTGLTPTELLEELYGFGNEDVEQGQQFQRQRKKPGGSSRTHWPSGWNPKTSTEPREK